MKTTKKKAAKKTSKYRTSDGLGYLTKRVTVSKAKSAGKKAATDAMRVMGYVVVAQDGAIVKKFADGRTEIIEAINQANQSHHIALD